MTTQVGGPAAKRPALPSATEFSQAIDVLDKAIPSSHTAWEQVRHAALEVLHFAWLLPEREPSEVWSEVHEWIGRTNGALAKGSARWMLVDFVLASGLALRYLVPASSTKRPALQALFQKMEGLLTDAERRKLADGRVRLVAPPSRVR